MVKREWQGSGVGRPQDVHVYEQYMSPENREKLEAFKDSTKWFLYAERIRVFLILMIPVVVVAFLCIGCRRCYRRCGGCWCCNPCRWVCNCCCRICCCGRRAADEEEPPSVKVGDADVELQHLRRRKELRAAYALWFCGGLTGAHHFYLGRPIHGILSAWSLNFLFFGWVLDMALMPLYVGGSNWEVAYLARDDGSCRRLCCRLPHALLAVGLVYFLLFTQVPDMLQRFEVVDVETLAANTTTNPYDLLKVPHNCTLKELKEAYSHQLQRLPKGILCGKDCDFKKVEFKKAYDFISGDSWRRPTFSVSSVARYKKEMDELTRTAEPVGVTIKGGRSFDDMYEDDEEPAPAMATKTVKLGPKKDEPEEEEDYRDTWDDWSNYLGHEWKALARTAYDKIRGSDSPSPAPEAEQGGEKEKAKGKSRGKSEL